MRCLVVTLSLVIALLLGVIATTSARTQAQEATPDPMTAMMATATHPLAGAWQIVSGVGADAFPSVAIFHADGSYTEVLPWGAVLLGAWTPTDDHTAAVTQVFNYMVDDELVQGQGRLTVTVDETGNAFTMESVSLGRFQNGQTDFTDEGLPTIGIRLEAGPMLSLEGLMATPVLVGAAPPAAGTPTP